MSTEQQLRDNADVSPAARILQAGRQMFFTRGAERTSIRDIAGAIGVSPATFYNYYPSKDALLMEVVETSHRSVEEAIAPIFAGRTASSGLLMEAFTAHARLHLQRIPEVRFFALEMRHMARSIRQRQRELGLRYEGRYHDVIDHLVSDGLVDLAEPRVRMRFVLNAGIDVGRWYRQGGRLTEDEVADEYAAFGLAALGLSDGDIQCTCVGIEGNSASTSGVVASR